MAEQWCVLGSCWSCYRNSEGLFGLDNLWSTLVIYYKCVTHARGRPCVLTSALWWHFGFAHFISEPPQVFIQFCTNIFVYFTAYMIQELCKTPDRWPKVFSKMSCCSLAPCKDNKGSTLHSCSVEADMLSVGRKNTDKRSPSTALMARMWTL